MTGPMVHAFGDVAKPRAAAARGPGRRARLVLLLVACGALVAPSGLAAAEPGEAAAGPAGRSRGVRLLAPGEAMTPIAPFPAMTPRFLAGVPSSLEKVRVAVVDGQARELDGLASRAAAFEVVPVTSNPDLVWNARSGTASSGGQVIAYGVARVDLPAVIDRTAVVRGLEREVAARPQTIRLVSGRTTARKGDEVEIEVGDVAERALVLFGIVGDGTVRLVYPRGGEARVVRSETFRRRLEIGEPFGADLIVAVSAAQPMDALEQGLREISRHRSAGEILKILSLAAPSDARIGTLALSTLP